MMMKRWLVLALAATGCMDASDEDPIDDSFIVDGKADTANIEEGSPEAVAVLELANHTTESKLRTSVGLSTSAAHSIATHRHDDGEFATLADLDDVPYVGVTAFRKLLGYARAKGLVTDVPVGTGTLLDCNISFGPDQQATVIGNGTTLELRELTNSGSIVERALSVQEWASHKIHLRSEYGETSTLTKDGNDWSAATTGGGFNELGFADCWVDKS
jgi:hypothetical protein